tara:strand:+ start:98 stop:847 length:750 start_codon:yes stop_codon:yes gene_type:complete
MKRKFWQKEWQGINFSELDIKLNFFKAASSDFYSKFYNELFCRYNSYEDLPSLWRQEKSSTANAIAKIISEQSLVLSIGCGLGFVEKEIVSQLSKLSIDAFDFSETANKWLLDVDRVNTLQSLEKNKKYNFIYCTQLLYALSNDEIFEFSTIVKERLSRGGKFMTVDTSINPIENGIEAYSDNKSIKLQLMNIVSLFYLFLMRRKIVQFWGWQRNNNELIRIFLMNGFTLVKDFPCVEQSFLIFEVDEL